MALLQCGTVALSEAVGDETYTLYRSSVVDPEWRVHVATFDTENGKKYNAENCQTAARLFLSQDGVVVLYWCEPGHIKDPSK